MKKDPKILLLLAPLIVFIAYEGAYFFPKDIVWFFVLLFFTSFFPVWLLHILPWSERFRSLALWHFVFPFFLFLASGLGFSIFFQNKNILHGMAAFVTFFCGVYFYFLSIYFRKPVYYDEKALTNLSYFFHLLSTYFIASTLLSARLLLSFSLPFSVSVFSAAVFIFTLQFLWLNQVDAVKRSIYALTSALLFAELFWTVSFLPHDPYILAFAITLFFYLWLKLSQIRFRESLTFARAKNYIIMGGVFLFILFSTAAWR